VVSFSGSTLVVRPEGETATMRVTVRPATRILEQETRNFSDIQVGDFIGATLTGNAKGGPAAQELHIFPKSLQGSGEGLYPATAGSPNLILNGTVGQMNDRRIGIKFRGAAGEGPYNNGKGCYGRAPIDPLGGCQGNVIISVPDNAPIIALVDADKSRVKPGAVLALSIVSGPDGKPATPGFTIQNVATPPVALGETPAPPKPKTSNYRRPPAAGKTPQ